MALLRPGSTVAISGDRNVTKHHHRFTACAHVASPLGQLWLVATDRGIAGIWFDDQSHHPGALSVPEDRSQAHVAQAAAWLDEYWRLTPARMRAPMPSLDPQGTAFQLNVWRALLKIAPGRTSTYGAIAEQVGAPQGARAVGAAVGRNPLGILVPCHRVIGRDGSLTGYAGGLPRKVALLKHESNPSADFALEAAAA